MATTALAVPRSDCVNDWQRLRVDCAVADVLAEDYKITSFPLWVRCVYVYKCVCPQVLLCTYLTVKVCVKHSSVLFLMHSVLFCLSTVFYLFCTHNYACLLPLLCVLLLFSYFNDCLFLLHSFLAQTPLLGSISISLFVCMCAYVIVLVCTMCFLFTLLLWVNTSIPLPVYHCLHSVRMRASSHENKPYREQKRKRK